MAITGAIFNSLSFGGVNSADYGIYITGEGVFNAPKRAVTMVDVPGRNGSIAIDQGHWENVEVSYPAGTFGMDESEFAKALSNFRNAIVSQIGYQRLTDTYHPDEYRMAIYMDGLEVKPTTYTKAGEFELKFNCKPQRWLANGATAITVSDGDTLINPTQYDAGPLLAIEGNGNISFNGYTVVVDAGEYGLINVKGTKILSDPITYSTKTELYNSGDTIEIYLELHWELISARSPRATRVSNLQNTGDGQTETQPFSNGSLKGTTIIDTFFLSSQDTTLTNVFSCDVEFSNGHTATTTLTLEVVWDSANSTLSFHTTPSGHGRWGRVVRTYPTSIIEAVSSKTYLGNPTYVDCELGEAYKIEDGEIVSLNKYIELGSDLPKLSSGANDVTISDTVTELKVTPNWWKL